MNPDEIQQILSRISSLENKVSGLAYSPSYKSLLLASAHKRVNSVTDSQLVAILQSVSLWLISKDQWIAADMIEKEVEARHG